MSSRREARSWSKRNGGQRVEVGVPRELLQETERGGFWYDRQAVERWLNLYGLGTVADGFYKVPAGLRQECIDRWALAEGLIDAWGRPSREKIAQAGIERGPGKYKIMARHAASRNR